ncbi:MAG: adenylate kinase [Bdellovibrionales bacterium]|nr:adenylate kinase [Bdellovibrionales bacterium]
MILVFLGPPGSGKGTQAKRFSADKRIPQLSTGDMLRKAIASGTELGKSAQEFMSKGSLVPDEVVIGLIRERIAESDCQSGFILDGFPRTIPQAQALDALLRGEGLQVQAAVLFEIADRVLVSRLTGRRTCLKCGAMYHVETMRPRKPDVCDQCSSQLVQREDDREDVILKRLAVYHDQTSPLENYYREKGILEPLDATQTPDTVYTSLRRLLSSG